MAVYACRRTVCCRTATVRASHRHDWRLGSPTHSRAHHAFTGPTPRTAPATAARDERDESLRAIGIIRANTVEYGSADGCSTNARPHPRQVPHQHRGPG